MSTVLITGSCGFIASHCVNYFLTQTNWSLIGLEGLSYAAMPSRLTNLPCWQKEKYRYKSVYWDLRSPIPDGMIPPVDYVLALASNSHVDRSLETPREFVLENVKIALSVLDWCRVTNPQKILWASTDEVFGPPMEGYAFEEGDPHNPSNPYAASKSAQESICSAYFRSYQLPIIVSNTMNCIGPGQHPEKLVAKTIKCLVEDKPITVHGELQPDGSFVDSGSRVYLHAYNFASAAHFIFEHVPQPIYPETKVMPRFNIAGDQELSNLQVVQKIAGMLKLKPKIEWVEFHKTRPGHDRRYALNGSKLRKLGWSPPLTIDESFLQTVEEETR